MATKTSKTKTSKTKTSAAKPKAAAKTNARAASAAPKSSTKRTARAAIKSVVTPTNIDWKQALIGGGIGAAIGGLATKLIFLR